MTVLLHETAHRLRVALPEGAAMETCEALVSGIAGVTQTRLNRRLACLVVQHDGRAGMREAVLAALNGAQVAKASSPMPLAAEVLPQGRPGGEATAVRWWLQTTPLALAAAVPWLGGPWRTGAAVAAALARAAGQPQRLRERPLGTLMELGGQLTLAASGQAPVVAMSVSLRWLAERLSERFIGQSDELLRQLLPQPAEQYQALREPGAEPAWWPLRQLRVGDRLRLFPGDVVPLDGCVQQGDAWLAPVLPGSAPHPVRPGDAVAAGERLERGTLELRVEADAEHSRLSRLQLQLQHLLAARPAGEPTADVGTGLALPLTAAALVLGFTGDRARAATLLQADPQQGPDLARPVAREAALLALARQGLLTAGPDVLQRLARSSVLLIEVQGVLSDGRWTLDAVHPVRGLSIGQVRRWVGQLAGADVDEAMLHLPERLLREWCRHGGLLRSGGRELHLADAARLQRVWGLCMEEPKHLSVDPHAAPRKLLAWVLDGRVVARLVFTSAWRPQLAETLPRLARLGFERIAFFGGDAGLNLPGAEAFDQPAQASAWLAEATEGGRRPALLLHRSLRDLVPPGSLSLSPLDADGGAHGLLVGEPLGRLVAARRLAQRVERQLRWRDEVAVAANASLMTLGALRLIQPMSSALLHHGLALALLLHSLRVERQVQPETQPEE